MSEEDAERELDSDYVDVELGERVRVWWKRERAWRAGTVRAWIWAPQQRTSGPG